MNQEITGNVKVTYRCGHESTITYGTIVDPAETEASIVRDTARRDCSDCIAARRTWKLMNVNIDDSTPADLEAFVIVGESWNGWALPYFTKEQADKLVAALPDSLRYDAERDVYLDLASQEMWEEEDATGPVVIRVNGEEIKTYPIGAGSWIWDATEIPAGPNFPVIAALLNRKGMIASVEYPGYIATENGLLAVNWGIANGRWEGDVMSPLDAQEVLRTIDSGIPADSRDWNAIAEFIAKEVK